MDFLQHEPSGLEVGVQGMWVLFKFFFSLDHNSPLFDWCVVGEDQTNII